MAAKRESTLVSEMEIEGLGLVRPGMKVKQKVLGRGVVEELALWSDGTRTIRVKFRSGSKWLAPEFAKLKTSWW
jgi:hypothetical protein